MKCLKQIAQYTFNITLIGFLILLHYSCSGLESSLDQEVSRSKTLKASSHLNLSQSLFSFSTPLGDRILEMSREWEENQVHFKEEYAQPRMCAHNVSHVLDQVELYAYGDYLVPHMVNAVHVRGGYVQQLPRSKKHFIEVLNSIYGGRLPVGTLLNGCLYQDCGGEGGDGHIALLGHTDENGVVYAYHNNWYRPDNEGGVWKEHMVSKEYYYDLDLRRQWMPTPWIKVTRDPQSDLIVDVENLLPALDDLDPFSGFYITLSIIPELLLETDSFNYDDYVCYQGTSFDPLLGVCVDAENAYGPFSQALIHECEEYGFGQACKRELEIKTQGGTSVFVPRWSKSVYQDLRGNNACPRGQKIHHDLLHCSETLILSSESTEQNALNESSESSSSEPTASQVWIYGPFSHTQISTCLQKEGGMTCYEGRWPLSLFMSTQALTASTTAL